MLKFILLSALFTFSAIGVSAQGLLFCNVQIKAYDVENVHGKNSIPLEGVKIEVKNWQGEVVRPSKDKVNFYDLLYGGYFITATLDGYKTSMKRFDPVCDGKLSPPAAVSEYVFMQKGDPQKEFSLDSLLRGTTAAAEAPLQSSAASYRPPIINDQAVKLVQPAAPVTDDGRPVDLGGEVKVRVLIDEFGYVVSARIESGDNLLRSSAAKAALESRFKPAVIKGMPIKNMGIIIYNFAVK